MKQILLQWIAVGIVLAIIVLTAWYTYLANQEKVSEYSEPNEAFATAAISIEHQPVIASLNCAPTTRFEHFA